MADLFTVPKLSGGLEFLPACDVGWKVECRKPAAPAPRCVCGGKLQDHNVQVQKQFKFADEFLETFVDPRWHALLVASGFVGFLDNGGRSVDDPFSSMSHLFPLIQPSPRDLRY